MEELKLLIKDMAQKLSTNTEETKRFTTEVQKYIAESRELKESIRMLNSNLKSLEERVLIIENEIPKTSKYLDYFSRRKNVILYNIDEKDDENISNLVDTYLNIFNVQMEANVEERDLDFVKRIGTTRGKRPVLVTFLTIKKKYEVLKMSYQLKKSKVFI